MLEGRHACRPPDEPGILGVLHVDLAKKQPNIKQGSVVGGFSLLFLIIIVKKISTPSC